MVLYIFELEVLWAKIYTDFKVSVSFTFTNYIIINRDRSVNKCFIMAHFSDKECPYVGMRKKIKF